MSKTRYQTQISLYFKDSDNQFPKTREPGKHYFIKL